MPIKTRLAVFASAATVLLASGTAVAVVNTTSLASKHATLTAKNLPESAVSLDNCPVMAEGYSGGCVAQLQDELNADDNAGLVVDGTFGAATKQAVINFQRQNEIVPADGAAGPKTKAALDRFQPEMTSEVPSSGSNIISAPAQVDSCTSATSPNGIYMLTMQCDGNLVLIANRSRVAWASNTAGYQGAVLQLQDDGNLVVYSSGHIARWASGTHGHPGTILAIQDSGNVDLIAPGNERIWSTNTAGSGDFVATPELTTPRYPVSFNLLTAAAWAKANDDTRVIGEPDDPCTYFVSRAMREGGGMPTTSEWFPSSLSRPWNLVQDFVQTFVDDYQWARLIQLDPADPDSSGVPVEADGSIANIGDIIYYQWDGVDSTQNVHLAMITGFNGKVALVTEQSTTSHAVDRPWNVSYIYPGKTLLSLHPNMKAYILHWE